MYRFFRYCELLDSATSSTARSDVLTIIASSRALNSRCTGRWWVDCARPQSLLEDSVYVMTSQSSSRRSRGLTPLVCRVHYYTRRQYTLWRQGFDACRFNDVGQTQCRHRDSLETYQHLQSQTFEATWGYIQFQTATSTRFIIKYL